MLYPYPQLQLELLWLYYKLLIWFSGLLSRRVVEKGSRDLMLLLLYIYIYHYYYNLINCLGYSLLMLQDRLKMLVFVRPSFSPLYSGFLQFSPLYSLPFPFDTKCINSYNAWM